MRPLSLVFASDSFKGSLTSADTARLLAIAAARRLPGSTWKVVPMADGGEGTVDALVAACGGEVVRRQVSGPLGEPVEAGYALLPGGRAVVEMAAAAGLPLVPAERRDPRITSTYGVGELVRDALGRGCRDITVALGGSATNDGGMGMMSALGVRFLDASGRELPGCGASLAAVASIDAGGLDARVAEAVFTAMCDVDNPLTGPGGATFTFGPQKCGPLVTDAVLDELESGMESYARVLAEACGCEVGAEPGAGAAGGLGAACLAFLHASLKPGIECVLDLVGFDRLLEDADLVVTGEGRLDTQTAHGKVASGIAAACSRHGVPCIAIVGGIASDACEIPGLGAVVPIAPGPCTLDDCVADAERLYLQAADRAFSLVAMGATLA